jgi:hypothetical protein
VSDFPDQHPDPPLPVEHGPASFRDTELIARSRATQRRIARARIELGEDVAPPTRGVGLSIAIFLSGIADGEEWR